MTFGGMALLLSVAALAHPTMTVELYRKFWSDAETAVVKRITLTDAKKMEIKTALSGQFPKGLNDVDTFIVSSKTRTLGVLANLEVEGADIGVAVDKNRKQVVKVFFYTTPKGMEFFSKPGYLKQFVGKTTTSSFKAGKVLEDREMQVKSEAIATTVKSVLLYLQKGW